jgi:hypothetical protein
MQRVAAAFVAPPEAAYFALVLDFDLLLPGAGSRSFDFTRALFV